MYSTAVSHQSINRYVTMRLKFCFQPKWDIKWCITDILFFTQLCIFLSNKGLQEHLCCEAVLWRRSKARPSQSPSANTHRRSNCGFPLLAKASPMRSMFLFFDVERNLSLQPLLEEYALFNKQSADALIQGWAQVKVQCFVSKRRHKIAFCAPAAGRKSQHFHHDSQYLGPSF